MDMLDRLQPVQKREAGVTANVLLSLIDRMKGDAPLPKWYSLMEVNAHNAHGRLAFDEGTEESARRAVVHFENDLKVSEAIGDVEGIATAKASIAIAKSKYEGGSNEEEVFRAFQEVYKMCIAELGEESEYTIRAGEDYAIELQRANRCDEARELLMKLLATSKQVLGSDHCTTKAVASTLAS
jgi:copper chaperone CopZ